MPRSEFVASFVSFHSARSAWLRAPIESASRLAARGSQPEWVRFGIGLGVALLLALLLHRLVFALLLRVAQRTRWRFDEPLVRRLRAPSLLVFLLAGLSTCLRLAPPPGQHWGPLLERIAGLGTILSATWLSVLAIGEIRKQVESRLRGDGKDDLEARRIHTQVEVLARTLTVFVLIFGAGAALMSFPAVRELGAGLLTSAGVAGLAVGLAARPLLENIIAGIQIALTQPFRLDDVVIVAGEWGRIEEITGTYVVVRIWDERRLIVPLAKFLSEPFQNWTRSSAQLLGSVHLYADYTVPVGRVRRELERIVQDSPLWDRRVCNLQVTDARTDVLELRALVSASDSGKAWDLRVHVREKLLDFLQRELPQHLPRARVELRPGMAP